MTKNTPINDFLGSVAVRGMSFLGVSSDINTSDPKGLIELCTKLMSTKGNASGLASAHKILTSYAEFDLSQKTDFFLSIVDIFGCDDLATKGLLDEYALNPAQDLLPKIAISATPRYAKLISRLNQRPASTLPIVRMRADLLSVLRDNPSLRPLDAAFKDVFSSWFNRGFLQLKKIDWQATGAILENIIRYEAVHGIAGWDDLARRIKPSDRMIYGFFHHNLEDEPLIFVEVALTNEIPTSIETILSDKTAELDPSLATTAVFYSISNCQDGLRGIELGNFLIKQVVSDLQQRCPNLKEFITLSPIIKFGDWMREQVDDAVQLPTEVNELVEGKPNKALMEAAAWFLSEHKVKSGRPSDPVCKFHIGNGARLEQINWAAQKNTVGLGNSFGIMANYRYIIDDIEKNHENFVANGTVTTSVAMRKLAKRYTKGSNASPSKADGQITT
jgi:malonyl-CoA decarboxylase